MSRIPKKGNKEAKLILFSKKIERLEQKIEKNQQVNKQKYRALQDFVRLLTSFASHDIKNAVHNMDGLLATIEIDNLEKKDLETLKSCVDNIRNSLEEFKVLSTDTEKGSFKLLELITSLQSLHRPLFKKENVAFSVDYINVDKQVIINQPFHQTLQVFNNLLINAFEFLGKNGNKEIKIIISKIDDKNKLSILICDTGIGIKPENKDKIFTPYFTTKKEGSGVGLAHVKFALEEMKGSIELLSEKSENYSTIFLVNLPV